MTDAPLKGKVVAVMKYSVAINLGTANNVKKGMKFVIYEEGPMIKDIEGNDLERLEIPKANVEVTHVQEKVSLAESFKVEKKTIASPFAGMIADLYPKEIITTERIPLKEDAVEETKPSPVKIGDLVRQEI